MQNRLSTLKFMFNCCLLYFFIVLVTLMMFTEPVYTVDEAVMNMGQLFYMFTLKDV